MSNYVQVRLQTSSSFTASINHDFRLSKVNYLRDNMFHNKWKNQYFNYEAKEVKKRAKQSFNEYNKLFSDNHLSKYGKRRKITKGKQSDYLTGVITLSPSVNDKLANKALSKDELESCFTEALQKVKLLLENEVEDELKVFSHVIHYDEKTPHLHFAFSNHTKIGEAVYYKLRTSKNKILSKCQDEVGKAFNKIGFVRGIVKDKTNATHKSLRQMHDTEIIELKAKKMKLKEENELLEKFKKEQVELKEQIKSLKEEKKQIKSYVNSLDLSATIAKSELDKIDIKIKELRKVIKYDNHLMNDIKGVLKEYELSEVDETVSKLLSRINNIDLINNPNSKMEVNEMLNCFNERKLLRIEEENSLIKSEEDIEVNNSIHVTSSVVRKNNK